MAADHSPARQRSNVQVTALVLSSGTAQVSASAGRAGLPGSTALRQPRGDPLTRDPAVPGRLFSTVFARRGATTTSATGRNPRCALRVTRPHHRSIAWSSSNRWRELTDLSAGEEQEQGLTSPAPSGMTCTHGEPHLHDLANWGMQVHSCRSTEIRDGLFLLSDTSMSML
jgi:hypothetical protein